MTEMSRQTQIICGREQIDTTHDRYSHKYTELQIDRETERGRERYRYQQYGECYIYRYTGVEIERKMIERKEEKVIERQIERGID